MPQWSPWKASLASLDSCATGPKPSAVAAACKESTKHAPDIIIHVHIHSLHAPAVKHKTEAK